MLKGKKYRFGLSKLIMARRTYIEGSTATYSDAFQCGEAQTANITPNYATGALFGDDKKVADVTEFTDAAIALGATTLPYQAAQILFGHSVNQSTGEEVSSASDSAGEVGVGFTSKNHDGTYDAVVFWRAKFTEGAEDFQTKGDGINFVTPSLNGKILAIEDDSTNWRVRNYNFSNESEAVDWICDKLGVENTFTTTKYTVTQVLSHAASSNSAAKVAKGTSFITTLTADTGYVLATPTVTMGGTDVTSTAWDSSTSKVTITSVTGNIVITETATEDV
jgi:phi13 family phage major tail protein